MAPHGRISGAGRAGRERRTCRRSAAAGYRGTGKPRRRRARSQGHPLSTARRSDRQSIRPGRNLTADSPGFDDARVCICRRPRVDTGAFAPELPGHSRHGDRVDPAEGTSGRDRGWSTRHGGPARLEDCRKTSRDSARHEGGTLCRGSGTRSYSRPNPRQASAGILDFVHLCSARYNGTCECLAVVQPPSPPGRAEKNRGEVCGRTGRSTVVSWGRSIFSRHGSRPRRAVCPRRPPQRGRAPTNPATWSNRSATSAYDGDR